MHSGTESRKVSPLDLGIQLFLTRSYRYAFCSKLEYTVESNSVITLVAVVVEHAF